MLHEKPQASCLLEMNLSDCPESSYYYSTLMSIVPSPGIRVTVAESLNIDRGKVSFWCVLWLMKLNANKTKTVTVSRPRTMLSSQPPFTIDGTVLKESVDLEIFGVTFNSNRTFEKHLHLVYRGASQRLCILRKYWGVFHDALLLGRCLGGDCPLHFGVLFYRVLLDCRYTP